MVVVRRGSARRKTQWAGFGSVAGAATLPIFVSAGSGSVVILSTGAIIGGAAGFVEEEVTFTRTIGMFSAEISSSVAGTQASFALGCAIARAEAISAGVASLPDPESSPDFEWLYYFSGAIRRGGITDDPAGIATIHMPFDVKGQRIVRAGSSVVWLLAARTATVIGQVSGRYLAKLT